MTNPRFIIQVSKGLIRNQKARRLMMFYGLIVAMVLLAAGSTLLWEILRHRPILFLIYWAACAWITLLATLLALYDIVRVRADTRRRIRALQEKVAKPGDDDRTPPKPTGFTHGKN